MKSFLSVLASLAAVSAHYTFPSLVINGATTPAWQYVRQYPTYYTNNPVTDITSTDIRCNVGGSTISSNTSTVTAGQTIGFTATPAIYHPGPVQVYLAAVPAGKDVKTFDGSGSVWFKIFGQGPSSYPSTGPVWPSTNAAEISFTIPKSLPSGNYLMRMEQIGLHVAESAGGAQFYISCAQLQVTGGGSGKPSPLVAFPGAYTEDSSLVLNIYYPPLTSYTLPGPAVWTG